MNEQDLTEQVAELKAQLAEYDEVAERSAVEGLAVLETAAQKLAELTAERDGLREKLNALKHAFGVAFTNNEQQMAEHVVRLQREVEALKEQVAQAGVIIPDLKLDLERLEIENGSLESEVVELKARLKNCHREIGALRLEVERYQGNFHSTLNVFKGRRMRIEEREAWAAKYIEDAYRERSAAQAETTTLKAVIAAHEAEDDRQRQVKLELQRELDEINAAVKGLALEFDPQIGGYTAKEYLFTLRQVVRFAAEQIDGLKKSADEVSDTQREREVSASALVTAIDQAEVLARYCIAEKDEEDYEQLREAVEKVRAWAGEVANAGSTR